MKNSSSRQRDTTVADVAKAAQVSKAQAARALGNYGAVSDDVRERVRAAAEELNYRPNELARTMNPNDPLIQIFWAWIQSCIGKPERALPAAEMAVRLNPCHPVWYNYYLAHILFRLARYQEAADLLERLTVSPGLHPRYMALRAAACAHLGRIEEAQRCASISLESVRNRWHGEPAAGPKEYVDWLVDVLYLRRDEDAERLREGLRRAGLPA